jgi:hypothetical protein
VKGLGRKSIKTNAHYRTPTFGGAVVRHGSVFACALVFSPERMAGQTACPEESLARARKGCEAGKGASYEMSLLETSGRI